MKKSCRRRGNRPTSIIILETRTSSWRCSLLEEVPDYMYLLVPLEGEHVFIACKGNGRLYYFPKSDIETGQIHPKLLIDCTQYQ